MTAPKFELEWAPATEQYGVIVGCSQEQEWLLPWWWLNYSLQNTYPVTFFNFGNMTEKALDWCKQRGKVITVTIPDELFSDKSLVDKEKAFLWENVLWGPSVWTLRKIWFKKPLIFLQSTYRQTIWLDLDCQVRGSLQPIFDHHMKTGFGIVAENEANQINLRQKGALLPEEIMYNCGVIAFSHGSPIVYKWCQQILEHNKDFMADQQLLARMFFLEKHSFDRMPIEYNWAAAYGPNYKAVIIHWWGSHKNNLLTAIKNLYQHFFINLTI